MLTSLSFVLACGLSQAQLNNYAVGQNAPNFTVTDLEGHQHQLTDYAGKWVMIDFFAYWCGPCAATAPTINEFYKKYGCNGYDVIVLALEYEGTTAQTQAFEDANGGDGTYPTPTSSGLDGGSAAVHSSYGPAAFPTIVLIGPDGKFKNIDIWPVANVAALENAFTSAGGSAALVPHVCGMALDITEMSVDASSVYPNPVTEDATVSVTLPNAGSIDIELFSVSGEKIASSSVVLDGGTSQVPVEMSEVQPGTYFIRITHGESVSAMLQVVKK